MAIREGKQGPDVVDTYFAPAARARPDELAGAIQRMSSNPVIDAVLRVVRGSVAVLNEQRQILALNEEYLRTLGIRDPAGMLGLRPGESLSCTHANDHPGGCGTGPSCSGCGAALAIVACQAGADAVERECVLTLAREGQTTDAVFSARACRLSLDGVEHTLLTLYDVSTEKRRVVLEQAFFHDINNVLQALSGTVSLLRVGPPLVASDLLDNLQTLCRQLASEVSLQRALVAGSAVLGHAKLEPLATQELLVSLQKAWQHHPALAHKTLEIGRAPDDMKILAEHWLVQRVLGNMVINAAEATSEGGTVRVWVEAGPSEIAFSVWNDRAMPAPVASRIFQRHFSTKNGVARGQGTFIMKFVAEAYLKGRMSFVTAEETGTVFTLKVLRAPSPQSA